MSPIPTWVVTLEKEEAKVTTIIRYSDAFRLLLNSLTGGILLGL
jgi:hypothetical protein